MQLVEKIIHDVLRVPIMQNNHIIRIDIKDMTTGYKQFIIENVTFSVQSGDIFGLLGRSGSGKSTILNTLICELHPKSGSYQTYLDENKVEQKILIGYSPQKNALYPFLTIQENLETFGQLYSIPKKELRERIEKLLSRLDLSLHKNKKITQLSGGMEKRVDLAVALIHNPSIIILDEPFNGLDISLQKFIWELLQELAKEGKIIIITSHLLADVQKYCTKFGLVENGKFYPHEALRTAIQQDGNLQAFLERLFRRDMMLEDDAAKSAKKKK